jgi:hypothetical protein
VRGLGLVLACAVLGAGCGEIAPVSTSGIVAAEPDEVGEFGVVAFGGGLVFPVTARSCAEALDTGGTRQVFLGVDDETGTSLEIVLTTGVGGTQVAVQNPGQNVPFLSGTSDAGAGLSGTFVEDGSTFDIDVDGSGAARC